MHSRNDKLIRSRQRLLNEKFFEIETAKRKAAAALEDAGGNELISLLNAFLSALEKETRLLQAAGLLPKPDNPQNPRYAQAENFM